MRVEFTKPAFKEFKRLEHSVKAKIIDLITFLESESSLNSFRTKKLEAPLPGYRIRIGDYRMLFTLQKKLLTIYSIRHRKDAYR